MTVKEAIEALKQCHPDAPVEFSLHFGSGKSSSLIAIEHEVIAMREQIDPNHIGCVYLHNTKDDFVHDEPLCNGNLFIV